MFVYRYLRPFRLTKVSEEGGVFKVNLTLITGEDLGDLMVTQGHATRGKLTLVFKIFFKFEMNKKDLASRIQYFEQIIGQYSKLIGVIF